METATGNSNWKQQLETATGNSNWKQQERRWEELILLSIWFSS